MDNKKVIVLIPSRLASTRLPNKPLADINGKTMIEWIYKNVTEKTGYEVAVAAGDQEIIDTVNAAGGKAILTDPALPSGSDRIAAALDVIDPDGTKYDVVVNFQGDAINTHPSIITELVELLEKTDADLTTCGMIMDPKLHNDPSSVKIAMGLKNGETEGRCLYFSRENVPHDRDGEPGDKYHHIGIYVYKAAALKKFVACDKGILETRESLEQLRALENGMTIYAKIVDQLKMIPEAPADIDTQEELDEMRKYLK